jgi:DNA polymerase-3 subunit delta'
MDLFGQEQRRPAKSAATGPVLLDLIRHQDTAVAGLREAWRRGKMPHAALLWGPEGVGRLRTAQGLAQLLLCEAEQQPCGACPSCLRVARFTHPDLLVLAPVQRARGEEDLHKLLEAYGQDPYHCWRIPPQASIGIERIRELKAESSMARVEKGNRVVIIREAEQMTQEAAQAALKLIEEPSAGTYLVMTCRDPQLLLPTIVSRCQRFRFRPLPRDFVEGVLRERAGLSPEEARLVASLAHGSLGRALAQREDDVAARRDRAVELFGEPLTGPAGASARVQALGRSWDAESAVAHVDLMMAWYEDLLLLGHGVPEQAVTNLDRLEDLRAQAAAMPVGEIKRRSEILEELLEALRGNVNLTLATESALLRLNGLAAGSADP